MSSHGKVNGNMKDYKAIHTALDAAKIEDSFPKL